MAVDAMLAVRTINPRGEVKYPVKAVNVLKAHGKSATESVFVKGYAINVTVASQGRLLSSSQLDLTVLVVLTSAGTILYSNEEAHYECKDRVPRYEPAKDPHEPGCACYYR